MRMNGHHHGQVPPVDHTSILVAIASRLGRVEQKVDDLASRIDGRRIPYSEMMGPVLLAVTVGAALFGKISWHEALPTMLGIVGR